MSVLSQEFEPTIDLFLYGALVKRARLNLGYRRGEDFVNAMKRVTGYEMSKDVLYRIENGKREPEVNFMIALNLMMGKIATDTEFIRMCIPQEWQELGLKCEAHPYKLPDYYITDFDDTIEF